MIQRVTALKTSDGQLFESEPKAVEHEANIVRKRRLEALVDREFANTDARNQVLQFLEEYSKELRDILRPPII